MNPEEIIDIIRAFFNAILSIFNSLKELFGQGGNEEPETPAKPE